MPCSEFGALETDCVLESVGSWPGNVPITELSRWPSGPRRRLQVPFHLGGREFEKQGLVIFCSPRSKGTRVSSSRFLPTTPLRISPHPSVVYEHWGSGQHRLGQIARERVHARAPHFFVAGPTRLATILPRASRPARPLPPTRMTCPLADGHRTASLFFVFPQPVF